MEPEDPTRTRGVAILVMVDGVDGAGDGKLDMTEEEVYVAVDTTELVGEREWLGEGVAIMGGAGERERTGVEAGVVMESEGLRLLCGRYAGGVILGLPPGEAPSSNRSRRNRKSRPYSSRSFHNMSRVHTVVQHRESYLFAMHMREFLRVLDCLQTSVGAIYLLAEHVRICFHLLLRPFDKAFQGL